MNAGHSNNYKVDYLPGVTQQIQDGATFAKKSGRLAEYIKILKEAVRRLQTEPLGWGEPQYQYKAAGGVVCHGILRPVVVHFVVFEEMKIVMIMRVHVFARFA